MEFLWVILDGLWRLAQNSFLIRSFEIFVCKKNSFFNLEKEVENVREVSFASMDCNNFTGELLCFKNITFSLEKMSIFKFSIIYQKLKK